MMLKSYRAVLVLCLTPILLGLAAPASAEPMKIMETVSIPTAVDWPIECTVWHEIYPTYCATAHQTGHMDNGDGILSACDWIELDGMAWHVQWVGPTYYLDCDLDNQEDSAFEPLEFQPGSPVCQEWVQVWPTYGEIFHVDDWIDGNDNGEVDFCDTIIIGGQECHVHEVFLNIHINDEDIPAEESSWSKMKRIFYGGLF
jgi:hypothetical protein